MVAASLITHGRIQTTLTKAKALRPFVEKVITNAKKAAAKTEKKAPTFPPRPPADDDLDMRLSKTDLPF